MTSRVAHSPGMDYMTSPIRHINAVAEWRQRCLRILVVMRTGGGNPDMMDMAPYANQCQCSSKAAKGKVSECHRFECI
jgi:hypothetical protein